MKDCLYFWVKPELPCSLTGYIFELNLMLPFSLTGYIFEWNQIYHTVWPAIFLNETRFTVQFSFAVFLNETRFTVQFHWLYFWMKPNLPYSCTGYIFEWNQIYRTVWMAIFLNWNIFTVYAIFIGYIFEWNQIYRTIFICCIFEWNQIHRTVSLAIFLNETKFTVQLHRLYFWVKPDLSYSLNGYTFEL